jgi:hypothetical protein
MKFKLVKHKEFNSLQQKIEYRSTGILQLLTICAISIFLAVSIITVWFAFTRIQNTIGQVESIVLLQSELQIEFIDFDRLEKVTEAWEIKHSETQVEILRDPFREIVLIEELDTTEI